jgi:hypothetical protein
LSKHPTRHKEPEPIEPVPHGPRLDERITELAIKVHKGVERHWKVLVGLIVLAVLAFGVVQVVEAISEHRELGYFGELFRLTEQLADDADPDLDALRALVSRVEGAGAERAVYLQLVRFLLARADAQEELSSLGTEPEERPAPPDEAKKFRLLDAAAEFAQRGAERFPDDGAIQEWALTVRARVDGEKDKNWLPPPRRYKLKPPGTTPAAPEAAPKEPGAESDIQPSAGQENRN